MKSTKQIHLHIYRAVKSGKIFRCIQPKCTHSIMRELLIGRAALCPYCKVEFIITAETLRRKLLHCGICTKNGKKIEIPKTQEDNSIENFLNGEI